MISGWELVLLHTTPSMLVSFGGMLGGSVAGETKNSLIGSLRAKLLFWHAKEVLKCVLWKIMRGPTLDEYSH